MEKTTFRSICQFCTCGCGLIIQRHSDGNISVEGDPEHPANRGQLCIKGYAIPELIQAENRIRYPMRRKKNGFEKISWDEALKIAADSLGEIRHKFGPLSLVRYSGAPLSYIARDAFRQFMGEFGSPNFVSSGSLCMLPRMTAFQAILGQIRAEPDYAKTNLVILWGVNPLAARRWAAFASFDGMGQVIPSLKKRGVRIIAIDPFRSETVQQADDWIRINLGSDAALGLAMIHVIIKEELYDKAFVSEYTRGFEELAEYVQVFSPKWAEDITGLSARAIEDLARDYATTKPAAICDGHGLDMYANAVDAVRTLGILMGLTGNVDVPGGNVFLPFAVQSALPTKAIPHEKRVWYKTFPLFPEVPSIAMKEAILKNEAGHPRAMIVQHSNPVLIDANVKRTRQALEKLDFIIVNEVVPTATSEMADLVLPMADVTECYSYKAYSSSEGGYLALSRPLRNPVGEARSVFDVEYELAERMGLHRDYPFHDNMSWLNFMIKPTSVTFERLEREQIVYTTPPVKHQKHLKKGFNTPSGKLDFRSQLFEIHGYSTLPAFTEPFGESLDSHNTTDKGFSLLGSSRRPSQFTHTRFRYLKTLSELYPEPLVWIHPKDAAARGIRDGDEVEITSPQGKIRIKSKVEEKGKPQHIIVDFGWGNPSDGKASINDLTSDAHFNPLSGATPNRIFPCEVRKYRKHR